MIEKRVQLTLFVEEQAAAAIEDIRREFNPRQFELIPAHVTLCREDELPPTDQIEQQLMLLRHAPITIRFGKALRFSEGKGVLLPAIDGLETFHALRAAILKSNTDTLRRQEPHITLMHPRNATCTDVLFGQIEKVVLPMAITFRKISLIEQEIGKKWQVLAEYNLKT